MTSPGGGEVTRILSGTDGLSREEALEQLLPVVYDELRALAGARLRHERSDHSLQPTALVHEAYIRCDSACMPRHAPGLHARSRRRVPH